MDYDEKAESIIKLEGLIFALAVGSKSESDLRHARQFLKDAIIRALKEAASEYV